MNEKQNISDNELIAHHLQGDRSAFPVIVRRYQGPMYAFLCRMTGNQAAADDLFQDTFLKVHKGLPAYTEQGTFKSWLFGIANNVCLDYLRRTKRSAATFVPWNNSMATMDAGSAASVFEPADELDPSALLELKEFGDMVAHALDMLPVVQREVFLLRHHADMPFHEIATLLGRPLNTVLSQMRSSLLNLRSVLREHYEYEPFDR
jgi:RNA polymerase sigma-70 factor (ECF subfamily)